VHVAVGAALIAVISLLNLDGGSTPIRRTGAVPIQLQALVERVVVAAGGRVLLDGCTMMGNVNLGVTCKAEGLYQTTLSDSLLKAGWQPTPGPPLASGRVHAAFVLGDEHLSFDAGREGEVVLVSARKRKP
jgi:hypothetical protein